MADTAREHDGTDPEPDADSNDATETAPATSGHSEAGSQAKRNQEDESPS